MALRQLLSQRSRAVGRAIRNGGTVSCGRRSLFSACYNPPHRPLVHIHGMGSDDEENNTLGFRSSPNFDHVVRTTLFQTRAFHVTAQRENFLIYGAGAAAALLGAGWVADQVAARAEKNAKMEQNIPKSSGGKNFYKGPFEPEMTKREAALILGVRESASADRIKEAHRRVLMLNHPDTGGSTYVATKINEAKEKLLGSSGASGGGE